MNRRKFIINGSGKEGVLLLIKYQPGITLPRRDAMTEGGTTLPRRDEATTSLSKKFEPENRYKKLYGKEKISFSSFFFFNTPSRSVQVFKQANE